ncbi:hypothetical protein ASD62_02375 [Phycicoccus sp. Root563]|uniref:sensor histidine kinase n=1 Tax=unclassified Phycicoccus TaxID=2637926 RepID=UPI000703460A|nr:MULTISPECIES: ATP-binding protein [unclassified Phycicoccus]KQU68848.1 hypothetical protein ASC58_09220 [Phycicoccus sp. Root101]KQZ88341.1 hypothetical protein ASD62_02375 [Phycicoccus sp. Root563]
MTPTRLLARWRRPVGGRSLAFAVTRYLLSSAVVLVAVGIAVVLVARTLAADIALGEARVRGAAFAHTVAAPLVDAAVRRGDPARTTVFANVMRARLQDGSIVHVKLWGPDGKVIWSDESALIGERYPLDADVAELFGTEKVTAAVSDLTKVENVEDRPSRQLLEVYAGAHDAEGQPIVFESYWSTDRMRADNRDIVVKLSLLALGALALFQLALLPLVRTLVRRVDKARDERNVMVRHALSASDLERRRIAADLHDGLVQDLTGLAYTLPAVIRAIPESDADSRRVLVAVREGLDRDVIALRGLLTDIYPADLADEGLLVAVEELAERAREKGLDVHVRIDPEIPRASAESVQLVYRVVREALRNVVRHAHASSAWVEAWVEGPVARVTVADDGVGMAPGATERGHVGLRLLADTLVDFGGGLELGTPKGGGVEVRATIPLTLDPRLTSLDTVRSDPASRRD